MLPTFETSRLRLRPRTLADTDACVALDGDPAVTRFVSGPWSDASAHRAFVEARTRGPYPPGLGYWTIARRNEPASFIGWVLLIPADGTGPEIEIGWRLPREAWGCGFATEAAASILHHAFATLKLPEVVAEIHPDNAGSIQVAEKIGLKPRGTVLHQGKPALRYTSRMADLWTGRS